MGDLLCERCKKDKLKLKGGKEEGVFFAGRREGVLKKLLYLYKFESKRELAVILAEILDEVLPEELPKETVVVPLPTIDAHIRVRGFDHAKLLAEELAKRREWKVENILIRKRDTIQVGADERLRIKQAWQAYKIDKKFKVVPTVPYLLLDDIWTTGSSMLAAKSLLEKAGTKRIKLAVVAKG